MTLSSAPKQKPTSWTVHKFGGTSVLNAERYRNVARILEAERARNPEVRLAVVLSAMKGVTDGLIELVERARRKDPSYTALLAELKTRHDQAIHDLGVKSVQVQLNDQFSKIEEVVRGVLHAGSASERIVEWVSGHGEVWSALIFSEFLKNNTSDFASDSGTASTSTSSAHPTFLDAR
ncbi:MAG: hypothetical protein EOP09_07645, partial [Proteobacteria bacterium]